MSNVTLNIIYGIVLRKSPEELLGSYATEKREDFETDEDFYRYVLDELSEQLQLDPNALDLFHERGRNGKTVIGVSFDSLAKTSARRDEELLPLSTETYAGYILKGEEYAPRLKYWAEALGTDKPRVILHLSAS